MKHILYKFPLLLFIFALCVSCFEVRPEDRVGSKELAEAVKQRKPKRIKDSDLAAAANSYAKRIATQLPHFSDSLCGQQITLPDSLPAGVKVFLWCEKNEQMQPMETQLFDAYAYSIADARENIQVIKDKREFLYTLPVVEDTALKGMWSIWLTQRQVVLNYKQK